MIRSIEATEDEILELNSAKENIETRGKLLSHEMNVVNVEVEELDTNINEIGVVDLVEKCRWGKAKDKRCCSGPISFNFLFQFVEINPKNTPNPWTKSNKFKI